ncbi:hypothetical protein YC2023_086933 [Brassica napus]
MATVVLARFSASTSPIPDPDPPFTLHLDLLVVAPPPEPPNPPDPSDSFLPLCRPYILEVSASSRRSRSSFDGSALVSSGMQLSTALCSPILGENPWLPFAGPFAPCIKRSQGLGFSFEDVTSSVSFIKKLYLLEYEDITLWCTIFLPQYEDIWTFAFVVLVSIILGLLIWQWSSSQLSAFIKQDSESVAVLGGLFPKLPHALNGVGTRDSVSKMVLSDVETMSSIASLSAIFDVVDLLTTMALETLMFFPCEIVWNCQDAKEVSQALGAVRFLGFVLREAEASSAPSTPVPVPARWRLPQLYRRWSRSRGVKAFRCFASPPLVPRFRFRVGDRSSTAVNGVGLREPSSSVMELNGVR